MDRRLKKIERVRAVQERLHQLAEWNLARLDREKAELADDQRALIEARLLAKPLFEPRKEERADPELQGEQPIGADEGGRNDCSYFRTIGDLIGGQRHSIGCNGQPLYGPVRGAEGGIDDGGNEYIASMRST